MAWATGAVWEGAGAEGLVCMALITVLQDMAKSLCSAAEHEHAQFWRFSMCDSLCILVAAFHNRELEQPRGKASGCSVFWQDEG